MTYLFDFDGTLVDSMPTYAAIMSKMLDDYNIEYGEDLIKIITPLGYRLTARYYREKLGHPLPEDEIVSKLQADAVHAYTHLVQAKEGVIEALKALHARGDHLNVLTASPHSMLDPCLKRLGVWDLFDNVWSCEDFGMGKSDPAIYRAAAEQMGVSVSEVVFVDDNYNADKTAKEAGCTVYGIFDESSRAYEAEICSVVDRYLYRLGELL